SVSGIVSELRQLDTGKNGMHVYAAVYPDMPEKSKPGAQEFHRAAFGKGTSATASRISALAEAIERRSARFRGNEPIFIAPLADLGIDAVAPDKIQHFHITQLENPDKTIGLGPVPEIV